MKGNRGLNHKHARQRNDDGKRTSAEDALPRRGATALVGLLAAALRKARRLAVRAGARARAAAAGRLAVGAGAERAAAGHRVGRGAGVGRDAGVHVQPRAEEGLEDRGLVAVDDRGVVGRHVVVPVRLALVGARG